MADDDDFEPKFGRMRARGRGRTKKFAHRILAAANLAGVADSRSGRWGRFDGSRIGRGAGAGRVLANRDRFAALRQRRVIVKSRIVKLAGKGAAAARGHLRYIERDGTTRDGARGELYDPASDAADGTAFLARGEGDRHQFRVIVSPEDGAEYDDLKSLTRRLMISMERDLGTKLDWVAVDHFNTGHPHTHIIIRGKDDRGKDLIIARDYLAHGMRERAVEFVEIDLGPRSVDVIRDRLRDEVEQERLTSIDRGLLRETQGDILVNGAARGAFDQSLRVGRLQKLERLGLAERVGSAHWRITPGMEETLRRMGERGDIIRTMQRALADNGRESAPGDHLIFDPAAGRPIAGRLIARGLSDEIRDRHYLLVEATDGRTYYVDIGKGENLEPVAAGAVVGIEPQRADVRQSDRTVAAIAAANGGRYDVDLHLRHDFAASEAFAEAHVRRLEAIRRRTGGVAREVDGSWIIAPDHLERAAAYEAARKSERPVKVEILSAQPLDRLARVDAPTWLDRQLLAREPVPLRDAGFGREVREAQALRRQWLLEQQLAEEAGTGFAVRPDLLDVLQRRELARIGVLLSKELGSSYAEAPIGAEVSGLFRRHIDAVGGRYALIERSRDFTLVPWRPVLDRQVGKNVRGLYRSDGVSWTFGRGRKGPNIS